MSPVADKDGSQYQIEHVPCVLIRYRSDDKQSSITDNTILNKVCYRDVAMGDDKLSSNTDIKRSTRRTAYGYGTGRT